MEDKVTVYVAAGDPLGARAVNHWRATGQIPADCAIATSQTIPPGYGFISPRLTDSILYGTTGTILKFEPTIEPASAPTDRSE